MTSSPDPTPDHAPPPPRRLMRSGGDRMLAGVAGGIARHFELDPSLVRIAFVVLTLFGGLGLGIYAVCALVVPADADAPPMGTGAKVAIGAVAVAALIAFPFAGVFVAPGIAGIALLGALAVVAWRAIGGRPDARLLRASVVVLVVLASLAIGAGAGAAAAFGAGTTVAAVTVGAGIVLIVGGLLGGARWLVLPALLLALPVSVVSAADLDLEGGVGEREYRPATVSDVRSVYRLGAGELDVDLGAIELAPGQDLAVDVRLGAGRAEITVPDGACVLATGHAGVGHIDLLGRVNEGVDVDADRGGLVPPGAPTLRLDLRVGAGELVVEHDGAGLGAC